MQIRAAAVLTVVGVLSATLAAQSRRELLVYFGTYTNAKSQGIYVSRLDLATGALSAPELAAQITNPSFLAVHRSGTFLYAVNEIENFGGQRSGSVSAFAIDRHTGQLTPLNQQPSVGAGPAHITLDSKGRNALVANYGGGSVAVLPIDRDGRLRPASAFVQHTGSSINPDRQKSPHAHSINVDAADRFAYVADLGLDQVLVYRFDPRKGSLAPGDPPFAKVQPGAGPRHFAIHPDGRLAYVINEMLCTVTAFRRDRKCGSLTEIQTISTLPENETVKRGYSTAEVQVHPSGRFLYGSNRGHDSIVVFAIDDKTGRLTYIHHQPTEGSTPRNFGIDPTGTFLLAANQRSDSVVVFRIDRRTGRLTPTGHRIAVGTPVCVRFVKPR